MIYFLLSSLLALGILLVFWAMAQMVSTPTRVDQVMGQYVAPRTLEEMELSQPFSQRVVRPIVGTTARALGRLTPQNLLEETRTKLDQAGNPSDLPPLEFLGLRGISTILTLIAFLIFFTLIGATPILIPLLSIAGGILGFYLPLLWLNMKIRTRKEDIQLSLPDALDMLTICVEAGWSLDTAITKVTERWNNELGRAFARFIREVRVGKPRHDALRDMANRADVDVFTNFIAAVIQSEQLGTGIAKVLRIQSEQMRVLRRQRAQARANTTPVKLVFPLVLFFFPSMFVVVLGPAIIRLVTRGF